MAGRPKRQTQDRAATVYVLFDCRDYYGPYFVCNYWSLEGAQAAARVLEPKRKLEWLPMGPNEWETKFGAFKIELQHVNP